MNDKVTFTEKDHKYTGSNGREYISVTTLISKYKTPFDKDYWSTYKAIERIVINKLGYEYFNKTKKQIGYESIIPHFLPRIQTPGLLESTRQEILFEWEQKKQEACDKGTLYHKRREDETNSQVICVETGLPVIVFDDKRDLRQGLVDGVYTELVLWNEEFGIAGQADKVIIENGVVDIDDYKTSKKIDLVSFNHYERGYEMMKYPLSNLMNCNFIHYTLQLSLYGWMLESIGLEVRKLRIYHSTKDTWYELNYLKDSVETLIRHYKGICQKREIRKINK